MLRDDFYLNTPASAHELAGFREWVNSLELPKRSRIVLVDGHVVIDSAPERVNSHNAVRTEITTVHSSLTQDRDLGEFFPRGVWFTNDAAGLSAEPDALFASWESFDSGRITLVIEDEIAHDGRELRGTPDWVMEVVSPNSFQLDTGLLAEAYYRAGIREYWLIDARGEMVEFSVLRRGDGNFVPVASRNGWIRSVVFGREFRFDRKRNRIGCWRYTLHVREK